MKGLSKDEGKYMFLTDRQKRLLSIFTRNPSGVSRKELEGQLDISRRTLYREFSELKNSLLKNNLEIINHKGSYQLKGDLQDIEKIKKEIRQVKEQTVMSISDRENAIAAMLLIDNEPHKIIELALDLKVSEATIQNDLNTVEKSLAQYKIKLVRKKGVGVSIETSEKIRRQLFVEILVDNINEYDFFEYLNKKENNSNIFLSLIDRDLLVKIYDLLKQSVFNQIKTSTDQQIIELILVFATTIKRAAEGHNLEDIPQEKNSLKYQGYVYRFFALYAAHRQLKVNQSDINYLANKTMLASYHHFSLSYDNDQELELSIQVKQFIEAISNEVKFNFQKNPTFIKRLTQHIYNLMKKRVTLLPDSKIETLAVLTERFKDLYQAIESYWPQYFERIELTSSEMQLILLYFAKEYSSGQSNRDFSALVVCENGIGTSAILSARLKQKFPEIKAIKISRVSKLNNLDLSNYDLILSTLKLNNFSRDYQLVSPLLLDNEISRIKNYLRTYEQKYPLKSKQEEVESNRDLVDQLNKLSINALFCAELVNGVRVQRLKDNSEDLIAVIQECLAHIDSTILKKRRPVVKKLLERVRLAPVGLPNSKMALLHTSSKEISRCLFTIFDLDNEITMQAMDHNEIQVKRILLMLGPGELTKEEQAAMNLISSMIIMDDSNLELFTDGDQDKIKQAIASEFFNNIKSKLLGD